MINKVFNEDCLEGMKRIADGSVDFILTDLPYGLLSRGFDSEIDIDEYWKQFKRVRRKCSVVALFGSSTFSYKLVFANFDEYKYKWIWKKNRTTNFAHAKNRPMSCYEEILIFSDGSMNHASLSKEKRMPYNPQGLIQCPKLHIKKRKSGVTYHNGESLFNEYQSEYTNYPRDILEFDTPLNSGTKFHPTQKPVDLLEYLIKTYTNEGETVLDATIGSGSTAVACVNTNRHFIGFETEEKFYEIALRRIAEAQAKKAQELL